MIYQQTEPFCLHKEYEPSKITPDLWPKDSLEAPLGLQCMAVLGSLIFACWPLYSMDWLKNNIQESLPWETKMREPLLNQMNFIKFSWIGLPVCTKAFTLFVHEHSDQALGLLTQEQRCLITAYNWTLEPGEYPNHLKAVAAAAKIAETSSELVQGGIVYLQVPHAVQNLLNTERTQDFLS